METTYTVTIGIAIELTAELLLSSGVSLDEVNSEREEMGAPPLVTGETYFDYFTVNGVPYDFAMNEEALLGKLSKSFGVPETNIALISVEEETEEV